jgi:uncharacterized protein with HEPN domain
MTLDRDLLHLEDMLAYARDAITLLGASSTQEVAEDMMKRYAVIRAVEIVGEAASKVSEATRTANAHIPWKQAIATRNTLIHGYRGLDPGILTATVRIDFPPLISALEILLREAGQ